MKRRGCLHPARPVWWPPTKRPRAAPGGLIAASVTCLSRWEGVPPCLRTSPPSGGTLGVHWTSWRIPFPRHASGVFLVLGFRGAWVSHAPPRVPKQRRPWDVALPPVSGSRSAGSPAWRGLPQCPGYGHWVSYCCVVLVFGFGFRANPANPGWGLGCVCLGTGFGFAPLFLAGVCGVCGWAWVLGCIPPIRAGVLGRVCLCGALPAPRQSWLACAVWVCVLGFGFRLRPAIPGRGFGLYVLVCALCLYPANPCWVVWCGCVCLGLGCGCAPPFLARVLGCVCWCVRSACNLPILAACAVWLCVLGLVLRLRPAIPVWDFGACQFVCALGLYPAIPGCAVWVCVLGFGFRLRRGIPSWGVGLCVSVSALG